MRLIFKQGPVEIWQIDEPHGPDFYVYGVLSDPVVRPSLGAAYAVAAGAL